jgi:adenylate cyclase
MTEARKLAAIMAVDVVGYSSLMGEDEAGTARAVREHREAARPIVAGFGGRIVKTMGDGLLLEFPSVVAAVECAIAIQKLMIERNADTPEPKRIVYRIGVNLGDVLIEGEDILGDGVNIAARLEAICEPGGILVSGSAFDHVRGKVEANFVDFGEQQLKNIARPVRAFSIDVGAPIPLAPATSISPAAPDKHWISALSLAGLGVLVIAIATGAWVLFVANRPASIATNPPAPIASNTAAPAEAADGVRKAGLPEDAPIEAAHLSIVVLPFTNLSGDPAQDYFADAITENLTTDLSRVHNSFVIARNTAFAFKGKSIDAKEIGKELGVRYVLEGSVQRDQSRVRVNAQLIDAETGAHLWADRFDKDIGDLFELQDQVVARLGNALGFELVIAEAQKSAGSKPDALDLAMRGWATMWQSYSQPVREKRDSHYAALGLFDQALKIDPNDSNALAGDAFAYMALFTFGETTSETNLDAKIIDQADRAIALAPYDMRAYVAKSFYLAVTSRASEALRAADAGLAIDPNSAQLLDARTLAEIVLGRFEQAKSDAQQAMRLSPRDLEIANRVMNLGMAELGLGNFEAAIVEFQKAIDAGNRSFIPYVNLAAAYALEGKTDEAKAAVTAARGLNAQVTVKWLIAHAPGIPRLFEGLRKAGLPEE